MQFDSLSIGDYTYDIFFKIHDAKVNREIDPSQPQLMLGYGSKIVADSVDITTGGNANNNSVALARLGKKVTYYNISGDDEYHRQMKLKLIEEGVDTSNLVDLPGHKSNYAGIINFEGEKTQIIFHDKHEYEVTDKLPITPFLYLSSVGEDYQNFFAQLAIFVQRNNIKMAFNPAGHQFRNNISTYEPILRSANMLFMNKEEAALILGMNKELGDAVETLSGLSTNINLQTVIKQMAAKFKEYSPQYVVITDGPFGSYSFDGEKHRYIDIWKDFPIVERTGCGDAYASAFMCAIMNGMDVLEGMRWGTFNGGSKVTKVGPQAGLLHLEEMQKYLKDHPEFQAIEI